MFSRGGEGGEGRDWDEGRLSPWPGDFGEQEMELGASPLKSLKPQTSFIHAGYTPNK